MNEYTAEQLAAQMGLPLESYLALRKKAAAKASRDLGRDIKEDQIVGPFPGTIRPPAGRPGMMLRLTPRKGQWAWAGLSSGAGWHRFATRLARAEQRIRTSRGSRNTLAWCGFAASQPPQV